LTREIPFLSPTFPPVADVASAYQEIVDSGCFSNGGAKERAFSRAVSAMIGYEVETSLVANATMALQLACAATFDPDRRFAVVPSFTFAAGPLALRWCGFEPVFVDVELTDWQPSAPPAEEFIAAHRDDVAGILLTQTFGIGARSVGAWEDLADRFDLPLVIDSAAGFGASYEDSSPLGHRGRCEVFSFHATKMLAIGEGGAVTARDSQLIERLDRMKNFAFDDARSCSSIGTNAKMPELAAAIGLLQLANLPDRIRRRRAVLSEYRRVLEPIGFKFQEGADRSAPAFVPAVVPPGSDRDRLVSALDCAGFRCRTYYNPPVHLQPFFTECRVIGELTATAKLAGSIISLPISDDLADETVAEIADAAGAVV
jgi:dTDP-4-amino-4,6-dideoxygalactose transaminase